MQRLLSIIIISLLFFGFTNPDDKKEDTIRRLKANVKFLASDELEGRYTGAHGERVAGQFIASELEKYGIKPFGENGTYFQEVPLFSKILDTTSTITLYKSANEEEKTILKISKDFAMSGGFLTEKIDTQTKRGIAYVGFGITAEEYGYDDYSGMDVEGKLIIFHFGEPYSEDENYFAGQAPTEHSLLEKKFFLAASKNVAGIICLLPESSMANADAIGLQSFNESICFPDDSGISSGFVLPPVTIMYPSGAEKIFSDEKNNYKEIIEKLKSKEEPESFILDTKLRLTLSRTVTGLTGRNVIGLLEGNDPLLKKEFIILSAHYDHLGMTNGVVFNGADDNVSGTAAIMEVTRQLYNENKNARSVITILYTGEEKGLLGSTYFVSKFPGIENVVVNINIDMCGRESIDTLFCVGPDRTSVEFDGIIKEVNKKYVGFTLDYSNSNYEWIHRSDLAPYYKIGIPLVDFGDNMSEDYHRPTDDTEKINFEKMYKATELVKSIALEVANLNHKLQFTGDL